MTIASFNPSEIAELFCQKFINGLEEKTQEENFKIFKKPKTQYCELLKGLHYYNVKSI